MQLSMLQHFPTTQVRSGCWGDVCALVYPASSSLAFAEGRGSRGSHSPATVEEKGMNFWLKPESHWLTHDHLNFPLRV